MTDFTSKVTGNVDAEAAMKEFTTLVAMGMKELPTRDSNTSHEERAAYVRVVGNAALAIVAHNRGMALPGMNQAPAVPGKSDL